MSDQTITKSTITTIQDARGRTVLEIGFSDTRIIHSDGGVEARRNSDSIITVCNAVWSPMQLMEKPPRHVAICEQCRHPPWRLFGREEPTHGIALLSSTTLCKCGARCCPKHREQVGGQWMCPACAKSRRRWNWLWGLFYERSE